MLPIIDGQKFPNIYISFFLVNMGKDFITKWKIIKINQFLPSDWAVVVAAAGLLGHRQG